MSETTCYRYETAFYVRERHDEGCGGECSGCLRCTAAHCLVCRRPDHLEPNEEACPKCIGHTREDLRKIERYDKLMLGEAIVHGVASEAASLAGPCADVESLVWRRVSHMAGRLLGPMPEEDPHHPIQVLGRWDMMIREDYDQPTDLRVTVSRAVAYLTGQLTMLSRDPYQDFTLFAREIRRCRMHLEDVLHDRHIQDTGVPCLQCSTDGRPGPPLVKVWARREKDESYEEGNEDAAYLDTWQCPWVGAHWWTDVDYRKRVEVLHLMNAQVLTADQICDAYRVEPSTLRRWANGETPTVRKCGYDGSGCQLYSVEDVKAMRDTTAPTTQAS